VATEERFILASNGRTQRKKEQMEQLSFPELVDIETVAKLLGVGERYVRRMVAERRVPTVKIGHYVRFDLADIRKWVEEQRRPDAP
jgi:excisionase family DNA binding protein